MGLKDIAKLKKRLVVAEAEQREEILNHPPANVNKLSSKYLAKMLALQGVRLKGYCRAPVAQSAARSRGRGAPRADRGGRTRRRHLLWPAAVARGCCVYRCRSGSPSLFWAAGSRVGRWSSTGRCPPATSRRARPFGEGTRAPLLAHRVGRLAGCKGKSRPCVLAAAGTAVCRPPAPEDAAMGSVGTEAAAGGRR